MRVFIPLPLPIAPPLCLLLLRSMRISNAMLHICEVEHASFTHLLLLSATVGKQMIPRGPLSPKDAYI